MPLGVYGNRNTLQMKMGRNSLLFS